MPYEDAWTLQKELFDGVLNGREEDTILLVEHPHVYTFGRSTKSSNFLLSQEELASLGAQQFEIERGGDVTYHGPGQLVGYPILNLSHFREDLGWYLRTLEQTIISVLSCYRIHGFRIEGRTGVWTGTTGAEEKIAAIGVRSSRWCTMHGFALNVSTDLSYFNHIIPCGITDRGVTSMMKILGRKLAMTEVAEQYEDIFNQTFQGFPREPKPAF